MKTFERIAVLSAVMFALIMECVKAGCSPGFYGKGSDCKICPRNYYCPGDTTEPFQCPQGFTSFDGEARCMEMLQEEIHFRAQRELFSCSNMGGYYCTGGSTITECSSGYYCTGNGAQTDCSQGNRCPVSDTIESCPTGYYSTATDNY